MASRKLSVLTAALLLGASAAARADVSISNKPTSNMSCAGGVCTATAQKAVLNVSDLGNMLSVGDVAVKTGTVAKDIDIDQSLSWTSASRLTLDAQQSVQINKQVTVAGQGALTIVTNDTGNNGRTSKAKSNSGEFIVVPERGSVQFWDLGSSLVIDGQTYTLVYDIKTLAADIAANPSGFYALAKPYDASADGTYSDSAITTLFTGVFEGLGNFVSNLSFIGSGDNPYGFFTAIWGQGSVRDFGVTAANFQVGRYFGVALIAGESEGVLANCWATGIIRFGVGYGAGGLVGLTSGSISRSYAKVSLYGNSAAGEDAGGLVGYNVGSLSSTYASGTVAFKKGNGVAVAGLVG